MSSTPSSSGLIGVRAHDLPRESMPDTAKWRYALNNALLLGCVGTVSGAVGASLLFKSGVLRVAGAAFGGGAGLGRAYVDLRYVFGHDVKADRHWIASVSQER